MKKALVLAALASTVLASGAAMALPPGPKNIRVDTGFPLSTGTLLPFGVINQGNSCFYPSWWSSPFNLGNQVFCGLFESKTATSPNCPANAAVFRPGSFLTTQPGGCPGFDVNGTQYLNGIICILGEVAGTASGSCSWPTPFGGPYTVTLS